MKLEHIFLQDQTKAAFDEPISTDLRDSDEEYDETYINLLDQTWRSMLNPDHTVQPEWKAFATQILARGKEKRASKKK